MAVMAVISHESVRIQVNQLLDWRGVPVASGRGKSHKVTYADILRDLEPLNEGRDKGDRITHDSLWIHAKRHHDLAGVAAYWSTRMHKELRKASGDDGVVEPSRTGPKN